MDNKIFGEGVTEQDLKDILKAVPEQAYRSSAAGSKHGMYQSALASIDRFGYGLTMPNTEKTGITFITRPKLNLTTASIRQSPILATLDTLEPDSLPFAIRCMLDTKFSAIESIGGPSAEASPFVAHDMPFIVPLTNTLMDISGFPDFVLDTETSPGGFYSEDQTIAVGSDFLNRTVDLNLTFKEIQGGIIMALFIYWAYWIALVRRGTVVAYPEDIAARRLCYTSSIYRFVLDPTMRYITKWSKCTGCFPKAVPIGGVFNIQGKESFISSSTQFSVPFTVNHVEYMNPSIFADFNRIMEKYAEKDYYKKDSFVKVDNSPENNFKGLPWIDTRSDGSTNELAWFCRPEELDSPVDDEINVVKNRIRERQQKIRAGASTGTLPSTPRTTTPEGVDLPVEI